MKKRILIVTPRSPFLARGADELERLSGIRWFIKNGFEVRVITKTMLGDLDYLNTARDDLGIIIIPVSYKFNNKKSIFSVIKRLINPLYWDGASYEYFDPEMQDALKKEIVGWKPDLVWFDFTYLWPLHSLVKDAGIPVVTRSLNFEPRHFIEEEGVSLINILLYIPKLITEYLATQTTDYFLALNPNEEKLYRKLGAKKITTLPLQALPEMMHKHSIKDTRPLHVLFMGSSYTVGHNREAFEFIVKEVVPGVIKKTPDEFIFHITGSKFPKEFESYVDNKNIVYDGYVPKEEINDYFNMIDIMLSPSAKRVGMQGKVFEPLARSIPLITSEENIVGYPFIHKNSVLFARTSDEYVDMLLYARSKDIRNGLSNESWKLCNDLFSRSRIDGVMFKMLEELNLNK